MEENCETFRERCGTGKTSRAFIPEGGTPPSLQKVNTVFQNGKKNTWYKIRDSLSQISDRECSALRNLCVL